LSVKASRRLEVWHTETLVRTVVALLIFISRLLVETVWHQVLNHQLEIVELKVESIFQSCKGFPQVNHVL
jgi:hypothetical protein